MLTLSLRIEISQMERESQDRNISQLAKHGERIWTNTILLKNIYFCEFMKATALTFICLMLPLSKCKRLQDATKQVLKCSLLGSKKQDGLNDPKCSHWKQTNQPLSNGARGSIVG
jgi:hypothetical protein